ncbi:NAD(P)/FAD-dependent oxidoreductase [Tamlana sp. 2_MG-2023]|uniref:phytoene desaturase family protein n=1 Tax=unclassified Tamlana TaxID=2614803 RepID=UPI0026E41C8B|nr:MULTISPECIES: NAD(P)/FAD-dependent oxidoreductase [unclassified Tamlana]MDO6761151.1 NAD(P)/FAD-dependent oxidoreductase [Tamlana sp. 2_MG-2023]MDO6791516.1 NAD(P)/FAD-dependent oxidoreductase [Tamlana sp. 1_MG-2023]
MKSHYDIVIIGSGLGGLVSANILAKEGYKVCVLEKNNQYGGNLQTFVRDKTIFDTGVHYIGGLSEGQNLYQYFNYLGIMDDLKLKKLDEDGFDIVTFDNDPTEYKHAQGYDKFIEQLVAQFPDEEKAITAYCDKLKAFCGKFPLYRLKLGKPYHENSDIFSLKAKDYIDSITTNEKLRAVLAGSNFLYAGDSYRTPFYVHALSINSFIESSYRCINGGSQISKLLIRRLKENNGEAYNHQEVVKFNCEDKKITSVITKKGDTISGDLFISNIEPKLTIQMVGEDQFRKVYANRIKNIEPVIAGFSLYIVLKPNTFKYQNCNFYHFKNEEMVWKSQDYTNASWPDSYMISMGINKKTDVYGDSLTVLTYMRYEEVEPWANTTNTVVNKNDRGQTYEQFKAEKAEILICELEKKFPNIRACIQETYTSTPLSYRDYIGSHNGSMYGYVKDANNPLKSFVSPRTKIKNLLLTGQSLNMHGILGVTIGAVLTSSEIVGMETLISKIQEANKIEDNTLS